MFPPSGLDFININKFLKVLISSLFCFCEHKPFKLILFLKALIIILFELKNYLSDAFYPYIWFINI